MQTSEMLTPRASDTATRVVSTMRRLGVAALPRNYELFYEAATGTNPKLAAAIAALGPRPSQQALDRVRGEFLAIADHRIVEDARETISARLDEILGLLRRDRSSMEAYGRILGETSDGLSRRGAMTREFLDRIVSVMANATTSSIESRTRLVGSMTDRSNELKAVKTKLEEYKRLADTDPLTQLANRRVFDEALARIYDSNRGVAFGALVLGDVDRFKQINDRFGHPVGDRVLQVVAGIIRSTVKEDILVARTGGEEFALVLSGRGEDATWRVAEEVRKAIEEAPFVNMANGVDYGPVTISLGTCMATQAQGAADLYDKADKALYASKNAGRNRVTRFSSLSEGDFSKDWLIYRKD
ncbi:GGDEF domain-containing protein [Aquamicrobium sp. LC103]|nr:GGDEF domain-containing protein [Aquamicrobium sp. LC103]